MNLRSRDKFFFKLAYGLAVFTIVYNIFEGVFSLYFGLEAESVTLFGFGVDSFIEVVSGMGIAHMVRRIKRNPLERRGHFERKALRVTGTGFYFLALGLVFVSLFNIIIGHRPQTSFWGVIISVISIVVMWAVVLGKKRAGEKLHSDAILADAYCTLVCHYMSMVLLLSSVVYALTGLGYIDSLGGLVLAWLAVREGKRCFSRVRVERPLLH